MINWQDISTAPRNTAVIVSDGEWFGKATALYQGNKPTGFWTSLYYMRHDNDEAGRLRPMTLKATHWIPILESPNENRD